MNASQYCLDTKSNQKTKRSDLMSTFKKTNNWRINPVSRNASLRARPLTHKAEKTAGWNVFRSFNCFL